MYRFIQLGLLILVSLSMRAHAAGLDNRTADTTLKQPITGLVDMQTIGWHNRDDGIPRFNIANVEHFPGLFGGIVVNATWKAMQPSAHGPADSTSVDAALTQIRAYNSAHTDTPLGVNLRIFAGDEAPPWAKQIAGGPVALVRNPQGCRPEPCPITVGKVWDGQYIAAWREFQQLVAAKYDAEPLIRVVSVTSCGTQTDEPFIPTLDQGARTKLVAAGYTDAAGRACLLGAIADYAAWKRTPINFTINAFPLLKRGFDPDFAVSVMHACRASLGERCVLANHELAGEIRQNAVGIVRAMSAMGGPIHYQTEAPGRLQGQWEGAVATGIRYNATAIELWPDAVINGFMSLSIERMTALRDQFAKFKPGAH